MDARGDGEAGWPLEGAKAEGSKADFNAFRKRQAEVGSGLNAMAAAFEKLKQG